MSVASVGAVEDGWSGKRLTTLFGEPLRGGSGLPDPALSAGTELEVARVLLPVLGLVPGRGGTSLPSALAGVPGADACRHGGEGRVSRASHGKGV